MVLWLLVPWLLLPEVLLAPPATPGHLATTNARVSAGAPWQGAVTLPAGWAFVSLDAGDEVAPDLDLSVSVGAVVTHGTSHLARERVLVRLPAQTRVGLRVEAVERRAGAFRLGVSSLVVEEALPAALKRRLRLEPEGRGVRLFGLPGQALAATLERVEGDGDVDLLAFDEHGTPLAIAEVRAARETAVLPAQARLLLVRADRAASAVLTLAPAPVNCPLTRFFERLARTPEQASAIAALRHNPDFLRVEAYLRAYPGGLPLRLQVLPGLLAHGVERFGTYSQGTLTINPTIEGHRQNPQELVDTLIHELIHALLALPRADGFPLAADVLDSSHDERLRGVVGSPLRRSRIPTEVLSYLEAHYGPSASNPDEDFTDLNAGAQRLIVKVVQDDLSRCRAGKPTLVFRNVAQREDASSVK
ncbi:MAG: hypothetical protein AB7N76_18320 [Planctomycetota bacterium]